METNTQPKTNGALIGSFVIIIILILGGIYLMRMKTQEMNRPDDTAANDLSESDNVEDIEADLNNNSDMELDYGLE